MGNRAAKTIDKIVGGGLPSRGDDRGIIEFGNRGPCDGCGDAIHRMERMRVVVIDRAANLRFHDGCYCVWTTLKH